MYSNAAEPQSDFPTDIFDLSVDEQEHVAGGPEQPNDPGH